MKKKNIILLIAMIVCSSCENLLTLTPEDTLNPYDYFLTSDELELWTNQFYALLDEADGSVGQNADDNVDNGFGELMEGQRNASSAGGWTWTELRKINYYLQHSSNCKDEKARNYYDGVAYFFRAYFYFIKVRRFGDVPWYNQVLGSADDELLYKPRDSRESVMDSVMADLDKAVALLPKSKSGITVTKWTALAFKTRAALYEGTFRKYHGLDKAEKYLQQVVDAGNIFIEKSGYSLYTNGAEPYRTLFDSDIASDPSSGVILARVYSSKVNLMHSIQFNFRNNRKGLTHRFVNHYLMSDGSRFTAQPGWNNMLYTEEVQNRDPRLHQTILCPGYIQKGGTSVTRNTLVASTGYQPIKFVCESAYDGANKGITDWPLFRTAEVYLNYAEAKAELGTLTQDDLDKSINKIRDRVNMPTMKLSEANADPDSLLLAYYPNVTKSDFTGVILEIRRERTVELVLEGFRQWDLLRWKEGKQFEGPFYGCYFPGPGKYDMDKDGKYDLVLWTDTKETISGGISMQIGSDITLSEGDSGYIVAFPAFSLHWDEGRDYLWPIPKSEILLSGGKLSQNPGW